MLLIADVILCVTDVRGKPAVKPKASALMGGQDDRSSCTSEGPFSSKGKGDGGTAVPREKEVEVARPLVAPTH